MFMISHTEPEIIMHVRLSGLYPPVGLQQISRHQRTKRGCFKFSYNCFSSMGIIEVTEQFVGTVKS